MLNPDISQAFDAFARPCAPLVEQSFRCDSPDVLPLDPHDSEEIRDPTFAAVDDTFLRTFKNWTLSKARLPSLLRSGTGCSFASSGRSRSLESITYMLQSRQATQTEWDAKMRSGGLDSLVEQVD